MCDRYNIFVMALGLCERTANRKRLNEEENTMQSGVEFRIREITRDDIPALERMLYLAIHVPEGQEAPLFEIIYQPDLYHYVENFGQANDLGFAAELNGKVIAAAWARNLADPELPGYGYVDEATPELSIVVEPAFRGQGIGTRLLEALHQELSQRGVKQISLSVQKSNPARKLYERQGYQTFEVRGEDLLMVKILGKI